MGGLASKISFDPRRVNLAVHRISPISYLHYPAKSWHQPRNPLQVIGDAFNDYDMVYCDVQMPVAQGRELLQVVSVLRNSGAHPNLDTVFAHMQHELTTSIDIVENPQPLGAAIPTNH